MLIDPPVTRQSFEAERQTAKEKLAKGLPVTDDEIFAICSGCQNTRLDVFRISAELAIADFTRCEHCHVYKTNPNAFRIEGK